MPSLGLVAATLALGYFSTRFGRIGASGVLVGLGTGVVVIAGQAQVSVGQRRYRYRRRSGYGSIEARQPVIASLSE
jgi:hypothetical protein